MKKLFFALVLGMTTSAFAQKVVIPDFNNWEMTDISKRGHNKETLFTKMNRDLIKLGDSICSNRAMIWAYDFKRFQNVDAGKIFLFYTDKSGEVGRKTWWYHVAPVINEKGTVWVMDAGFASSIKKPISSKDWLKRFTGSYNCKQIRATDTDLIERMFLGYTFPGSTSHGKFDCYYLYTPAGYWTPSSVAEGLLGVDEDGRPVPHESDELDTDEVYAACVEAVTSPVGRVLGGGKRKCEKYLNL